MSILVTIVKVSVVMLHGGVRTHTIHTRMHTQYTHASTHNTCTRAHTQSHKQVSMYLHTIFVLCMYVGVYTVKEGSCVK